ncbi:TRAP transporter substrate-binding protein [Cytobacillus purgationiresistens]|uniref:TRAP-type C4-dicarboxylate transport system substrate-binding protein n=1 Tax=Cytobacillus purgationiresistens TaxID=863449 RepID=A0ABU0AEL5_9BACI|nr:TRAP transporter substrate-binding protein DctP [Cytobacillus purgationiresistens]MDQ0269686.1 TRAP-type C4-dicarboxylate transport system substrate-binding protein [Cytobacillus purgationiresistens]
MKKYVGILLVLLISIGLAACSSSAGKNENAANKVYELDVNNWQPSTHHYAYNAWEPWKELVEEKTDGRVKVNLYHGSSLGKSSSVYQDIKGGLYDASLLVTNYFYDTSFFPYTIGGLPFAFEGPSEASAILKDFGEKYAKEGLEDVILMPPTSTDGYDLFSTKPIKSIADLKNKKMRTSGKSENAFIEALGGIPVSITSEGIYEGLEKGMIDTAFYTPIGAEAIKYDEPAPYITKMGVLVNPLIPLMNKEFFESLPEDLQKLFEEELNPALSEMFTKSYESELEESHNKLQDAVKTRGEFKTLSASETEEYRSNGKAAWDLWIKDADQKGYDGQEMVDELFKMLEEAGYPVPYK